MNLHQFLNFRTACPMCGERLVPYFYSTRRHPLKYEDGQLLALSDLKGLKKGQKNYKAGYYFFLDTNSFSIDFFSNEGEKFDDMTHLYLIDKFRDLTKNQANTYSFDVRCGWYNCGKYSAGSNRLFLDFRSCTFNEIDVGNESFLFTVPSSDGYKIILMDNTYDNSPDSYLYSWHRDDESSRVDQPLPHKFSQLKLPLIPFISKEATAARLNTLLVFV